MVELFVYDASEVNRIGGDKYHEVEPQEQGFRQALAELNPPIPFLVRSISGDYSWIHSGFLNYLHKIIFGPCGKNSLEVKNTFKDKTIPQLLSTVLDVGHDRDFSPESFCAVEYDSISKSHHYYYFDDLGVLPQRNINHFSMILNRSLFKGSNIDYYQPDIEKRRKALFGIILSDVNPNRPRLQPVRFDLTLNNLERVVKAIQENGYLR